MDCTTCNRVNSHFYITCFLANWLLAVRVKYMAVSYLEALNKSCWRNAMKHCETFADIYI